MEVTRTVTRRASGGELHTVHPPCDPEWSKLQKLRWHAAVANYDTNNCPGITIEEGFSTVNGIPQRDVFDVRIGSSVIPAASFDSAWTFINGASIGIRQCNHHNP